MIIVGAGIAGNLACKALSYAHPSIYEAKKIGGAGLSNHHAIMRIRNPDVSKYLGCRIRKIKVKKAILFGGKLFDKSNLMLNNLYSMKLYDEIGDRSLNDLDDCTRYLIDHIPEEKNIFYDHEIASISNNTAHFKNGKKCNFDICISTIPLPKMLSVCGMDSSENFSAHPISVVRSKLNIKSNVNQTIYVPDSNYDAYRITLQEQDIIMETISVNKEKMEQDFISLVNFFGVNKFDCSGMSFHEQKLGKIISIDDGKRKGLIGKLTKEFNIYSFGRYAIWKPIRIDHLLDDVEIIKKLSNLNIDERKYEVDKEMTK